MVSIKFGPNTVNSETLAGRTVNCARGETAGVLNIPADAPARVNGSPVDGSYVLRNGDSLEFVKAAGSKGAK